MTREEALVKVRGYLTDLIPSEDYNEVEEIMSALEQQPCGDCISRQAVLDIAKSSKSNWIDNSVLFKRVNELPPVTPQPKVGRWFHREDMDYLDENKVIHNHFMCKDCGFIHDFIDGHTAQYKYCPSCGAKMEVNK